MKTESENKKKLGIDQRVIASLFWKHFLTQETIYELSKIIEIEQIINRDKNQ